MQNLTGFIVSVRPKGNESVSYLHNGEQVMLLPGEELIGYLQSETRDSLDSGWTKAHLKKVIVTSEKRKRFRYDSDVTFSNCDIDISIRAKRGPISNPPEFDQYETWNYGW